VSYDYTTAGTPAQRAELLSGAADFRNTTAAIDIPSVILGPDVILHENDLANAWICLLRRSAEHRTMMRRQKTPPRHSAGHRRGDKPHETLQWYHTPPHGASPNLVIGYGSGCPTKPEVKNNCTQGFGTPFSKKRVEQNRPGAIRTRIPNGAWHPKGGFTASAGFTGQRVARLMSHERHTSRSEWHANETPVPTQVVGAPESVLEDPVKGHGWAACRASRTGRCRRECRSDPGRERGRENDPRPK